MNLPELVTNKSSASRRHAQDHDQWFMLTPKTLTFMQFFAKMQVQWTAAQCVEALAVAGADSLFLDTLPEAILAPLQEAIVQCQTEPPIHWNKDLLALIKREDVTMLLTPGQKPRQSQSTLLVMSLVPFLFPVLTYSRPRLMKLVLMFEQYVPS